MTEPAQTVLSVRGDAQLEVAPDVAELACSIDGNGNDKASALAMVSTALDAVRADLDRLGAVVRTAADQRLPLTWLARSASSHVEFRWEHAKEERVPTGRVLASVALQITVRDFALMAPLGAALARHDALHVRAVEWQVDADNAAWPVVRAGAIEAAVQKGRDYAAALGGTLDRIEHVADIGLLAGGDVAHATRAYGLSSRTHESGDGDSPTLDPVPQDLHASVEARFTASVRALA